MASRLTGVSPILVGVVYCQEGRFVVVGTVDARILNALSLSAVNWANGSQ